MNTLIASSRRNDMRPLAFQGLFATDCHDQLRALLQRNAAFLEQKGMPHAATFLAEPVHDERGGNIDWYAEGEQVTGWSQLDAGQKEDVQRRLATYGAAVAALLEEKGAKLSGAELLRLAMQHPHPEDVYLVDGRPVLTNWGFHPGASGAVPEDIIRKGAALPPPPPPPPPAPEPVAPAPAPQPARPAPPPPPAPAPRPRRPFHFNWGWLLPLLLLLLLVWLLLSILGTLPPPLPAGCFHERGPNLKSEEMRRHSLEDEYAGLLRQLAERAALCVPAQPKPAEPIEQVPVIETPPVEFPPVETPVETSPVETPPVETPPEPAPEDIPFFGAPPTEPENPQEEPKELEIPKDAPDTNDLSFLEGCWRSDTGLVNSTTREPIVAEYCFDSKGNGSRIIRESNGAVCRGPVTAKFQGNRLKMRSSPASCPNGRAYSPDNVECSGKGDKTSCDGRNQDGTKWKARFNRKR